MTRLLRVCLWVSFSALLSATSVFAQSAPAREAAPPPAHLSLVEGEVFLERENRSEPAVENVPLLDGDRIRTGSGRAEIILGDGSLLHLDENTTADVLAGDLIRLLEGRINLVVLGARDPSRAVQYQVDAPAASVQSNGPGEYRVTAVNADGARTTELAVVRGDATFANDVGSVNVRAGERSMARDGEAPGRPQYFNSARWDEFDRWSATRRDTQIGTISAGYLPADLEPYSGTFDRYGTWRNDASNGNVWFPTVSAEWRPYSVGYWRQYDQWDSFWIAGDPWGWPTHHYGRWGFSVGLGWYWLPGRSWASASVYWALGGDYVSWCPLGWNDYPVFGNWGVGGVHVGLHDGWRGWTVIPRRHYGSAVFASHVAIDGRRLDGHSVSGFVAGLRSPAIGRAVPSGRATATWRTPGLRPAGGGRVIGTPGRGDGAPQRSVTPEAPRAGMRGQIGRTQGAETRSPLAALAAERNIRRVVPGAPAGGGPDSNVSPAERQTQRSGPNPGRRSDPTVGPASAERVGGRSLAEVASRMSSGVGERGFVPRAAPRVPTNGVARTSERQPAPWPTSGQRPQASEPTRAEPRSWPSQGASSAPPSRYDSGSATQRPPSQGASSAPSSRYSSGSATQRPPSQGASSAPPSRYNSGSATQRPPSQGASSAPSSRYNSGSATQRPPSQGASSAPTSRYNSGSGTQRPPSRGTSSRPSGRGGRPE